MNVNNDCYSCKANMLALGHFGCTILVRQALFAQNEMIGWAHYRPTVAIFLEKYNKKCFLNELPTIKKAFKQFHRQVVCVA